MSDPLKNLRGESELRQEIDRLREELQEEKASSNGWELLYNEEGHAVEHLNERCVKLEKDNEALRKDAERWRKVRNIGLLLEQKDGLHGYRNEHADAAIDAVKGNDDKSVL